MRRSPSRLTAIVHCAMTSRKGMANDRAGRAVKTTIRLIALFQGSPPAARRTRTLLLAEAAGTPAHRQTDQPTQHSDRRARAKNNRPPMPGRRQRGSTSLVDAINHKERTLPPPTPKGLKSDRAVGRYLSGAKFREAITGATTLDESQNPAGRTSISSMKS